MIGFLEICFDICQKYTYYFENSYKMFCVFVNNA